MITINYPPTEAAVIEFATMWTDKLATENYDEAYKMLHYVGMHPGRSWVSSSSELRAWISNYGSNSPIEEEPPYVVTEISTAGGDRWDNFLELTPDCERYEGYSGRLDWWLPLSGEWSDLQASFDLIKLDGRIAFVLVALRVP